GFFAGIVLKKLLQVFRSAKSVHNDHSYIGWVQGGDVIEVIDAERRNIVVSRRSLIERKRKSDRESLLKELEVGQTRKGVVKNRVAVLTFSSMSPGG
ncbi:hypothetical protein AB1L30_00875, partial [Bremerella sp. JC817]|uniref:hypothetical protein n=1 Tax=Bremerella sp. JC817 TaxID=3231756 RepID=UPI00345B1484